MQKYYILFGLSYNKCCLNKIFHIPDAKYEIWIWSALYFGGKMFQIVEPWGSPVKG